MADFKTKKEIVNNQYLIKYKLPSIFLFFLFLQIIFGAFVSGMDAGKIYNTWPLMGNNYFPDDNSIINLFKINALSDPSLVQFIHRNLAYLICLVYLLILFFVINDKLVKFYNIMIILSIILLILAISFIYIYDVRIENMDVKYKCPDKLEINLGDKWINIPLKGSWFIDSFGNRMAQLQRFVLGVESELIAEVADSWDTMALIEAAYKNNESPGTLVPKYMNKII